jgi:hypothetical protein
LGLHNSLNIQWSQASSRTHTSSSTTSREDNINLGSIIGRHVEDYQLDGKAEGNQEWRDGDFFCENTRKEKDGLLSRGDFLQVKNTAPFQIKKALITPLSLHPNMPSTGSPNLKLRNWPAEQLSVT